MYSQVEKLASAVYNDIVSGLQGFHINSSINMDQLIDDIISERLQVIKEYALKGILPVEDLYVSINCIPVECGNIDKCSCRSEYTDPKDLHLHFEIPQLLNDYQENAIQYIGSVDKQYPFIYYTSPQALRIQKYRKRGKSRPYVWIDTSPNENGMYDCWIFNAPLLKTVSVTGIFKDPRQLEKYSCCIENSDDNLSFIDNEVKKRLTQKKISYYRQLAAQPMPNTQSYTA